MSVPRGSQLRDLEDVQLLLAVGDTELRQVRGERAETSDVSDVSVHLVTLHHDGAVAQRRGSVRRLAFL